jgi:2-polyprenyl-3-methyl-5-hydroxy-6-metoxy-1,4-benzoquinol methylase
MDEYAVGPYEKLFSDDDRGVTGQGDYDAVVRHFRAVADVARYRPDRVRNMMFWTHRYLIEWILQRRGPNVVVLDVGCGTGILGLGMQAAGMTYVGVDPSPSASLGREEGLTIYTGLLDSVPRDIPTPDVCVLSEVLEHVSNPLMLV